MRLSHRASSGLAALALALTAWAGTQATPQSKEGADQPAPPKVGEAAPGFRLNDESGKAVQLGAGSKAGWTVLAFYPKAATPG